MSLPIAMIRSDALTSQLVAAIRWTSNHLHVPESDISSTLAVAYVVQHYQQGDLSGWDGFITDLEN